MKIKLNWKSKKYIILTTPYHHGNDFCTDKQLSYFLQKCNNQFMSYYGLIKPFVSFFVGVVLSSDSRKLSRGRYHWPPQSVTLPGHWHHLQFPWVLKALRLQGRLTHESQAEVWAVVTGTEPGASKVVKRPLLSLKICQTSISGCLI